MKKKQQQDAVIIDGSNVSFDDIIAVARYGVPMQISKSRKIHKDDGKNTEICSLESMRKGVPVYGVTTGYGKSCGKRMPLDIALKNGVNIFRFHGCAREIHWH